MAVGRGREASIPRSLMVHSDEVVRRMREAEREMERRRAESVNRGSMFERGFGRRLLAEEMGPLTRLQEALEVAARSGNARSAYDLAPPPDTFYAKDVGQKTLVALGYVRKCRAAIEEMVERAAGYPAAWWFCGKVLEYDMGPVEAGEAYHRVTGSGRNRDHRIDLAYSIMARCGRATMSVRN